MRRASRTFEEYLAVWNYAPKTQSTYAGRIARIEEWLRARRFPTLRRCAPDHIHEYGDTTPFTYSTRMAVRHALVCFWTYLGRPDCPAWAVRCPREPEGVSRAIEDDEKERVLEAAREFGPREYAWVCLMYYQAFRLHEVAQVRQEDVDDRTIFVFGKGSKPVTMILDPRCGEALAPLPRSRVSPWLFPGRNYGQHVSNMTINKYVHLVGAIAGRPDLTPHMLRHTAGAVMNDKTRDLRVTQEFLRHAKLETTKRYTRVRDDRLRAAMAVL